MENKELREKLRIEEEAVKILNEDLKEMHQKLKKAQRTASNFQERYNGLLSENRTLVELREEMQDILGECYEILVVNNWRGDLVERILELPPFNTEEELGYDE